jgi:hypothetical protein
MHRIRQLRDGVQHLTRKKRQGRDLKGQREKRGRCRKKEGQPFVYNSQAASALQLAWRALPASASEKPEPQEARTSMEHKHGKDRTPEVPHSS